MAPDLTGRCPCGLGLAYADCCGRLHRGEADAVTAEQLMRARYSAFFWQDAPFLLRSWHPETRPERVEFDPELRWVRLDVLDTSGGGLLDEDGTVEFVASYRRGPTAGSLHERSQFTRDGRRWVYVGADRAELDLDE